MDPNACLRELSEPMLKGSRRHELCQALAEWLGKGGFDPDWTMCQGLGTQRYRQWCDKRDSLRARLAAQAPGAQGAGK
jgi:hypothetical protein